MYSFQRMKPGQIALLASLCTQEDEDNFRQKLLADKPEHKVGFVFMTGTSDEIKNKLQRCIIGCAFKHQIITRQESAIFTFMSGQPSGADPCFSEQHQWRSDENKNSLSQ